MGVVIAEYDIIRPEDQIADALLAGTGCDGVDVRFFDDGCQLAALVHWGEAVHADRVKIATEKEPTEAEIAMLVDKLNQWRAERG